MEKVRFGIIGAGNQGTYYTGLFHQELITNGVLTALADTNVERAKKLAEKYPEMELACFKDYKEMLDSGTCDAILVETPHYDHAELVIECLKRGIHVVCDKPAGVYTKQVLEMNEVANILRNATSKSLLILDEIGRGTSTFDGLSIAWAVVEHISNTKLIGAKTLFATHYHELTELEGKLNGVNNYCIAVKEKGDDIVFLRKIIKGGADKSYGIQVAKLAGLPDTVIERAKEIVNELVANDITEVVRNISIDSSTKKRKNKPLDEVDLTQMSLFDTISDEDIINELRNVDIGNLTPLEALNKLYELQNKVKNRW